LFYYSCKKQSIIIICLLIVSLVFCSCSFPQRNSQEKNTTVSTLENNNVADKQGRLYSTSVLNNGNIINAYLDDNNTTDHIFKLEIVDSKMNKVEKVIDVSSFDIREVNIFCLNDYFYICANQIYVYDYSGNLIKKINYPVDIEVTFDVASSVLAISNDLSKMVYNFRIEDYEEDKIGIMLFDLNTNKKTVIQELNEPVTDKPCGYKSLHFSSDDKMVMFLGQKYLKINDGRDCYGIIDLNSLSIKSEFSEDSYCRFIKNSGYVYDKCVDYGKSSSGRIIKFNPTEKTQIIQLKSKNESQHIGLTDKENMFVSALCDWSDYSIEIRLYENGNAVKKASIKCKDEEEFNLIDVDAICYSSKSNKVYYTSTVWNGDDYMGQELFEIEMK